MRRWHFSSWGPGVPLGAFAAAVAEGGSGFLGAWRWRCSRRGQWDRALIACAGVASWLFHGPRVIRRLEWKRGLLLFLGVAGPWYVAIGFLTDGDFYRFAVGKQIAARITSGLDDHGGFPGYYLVTSVLTFHPWSALIPAAVLAAWARRKADPTLGFLLGWIVGPLVLFELVRTKLVHYYLPAYPAWRARDGLAGAGAFGGRGEYPPMAAGEAGARAARRGGAGGGGRGAGGGGRVALGLALALPGDRGGGRFGHALGPAPVPAGRDRARRGRAGADVVAGHVHARGLDAAGGRALSDVTRRRSAARSTLQGHRCRADLVDVPGTDHHPRDGPPREMVRTWAVQRAARPARHALHRDAPPGVARVRPPSGRLDVDVRETVEGFNLTKGATQTVRLAVIRRKPTPNWCCGKPPSDPMLERAGEQLDVK